MKQADLASLPESCWMHIGVWGDGSCPELPNVSHCRNCRVYSVGGRQLLDRLPPDNYLDLWTDLLAKDKNEESSTATTYLVFRVGQSWLAMRALTLRELTRPTVIRSVPHQQSEILLGLAAVRGEILPCFSLHALLDEPVRGKAGESAYFLVARHEDADWIFPVDEVSGIHDVPADAVEPLPTTLTHAGGVYTMGIARCGDRPVGLVDEELVFGAIARRMT